MCIQETNVTTETGPKAPKQYAMILCGEIESVFAVDRNLCGTLLSI